jgi:ribonuclease BN (tRNA processing enzyme)
MRTTFHGVRGSFPSPGPTSHRYGGNTSSVSLQVDGQPLLLLDLGTGLPLADLGALGHTEGPLHAVAFVSHLHLDHIIGLPFFPPLHEDGSQLDIYAPPQPSRSLRGTFEALMQPPFFPVALADVRADVRFHEVLQDDLDIGNVKVTIRPVPHVGPTVGYRIRSERATVAYVSDHQAPLSFQGVADSVLELCEGVDLLIHEGQYTPEEFARKADWGHCTPDYALLVAREAGARRMCFFHHDPWRTDDALDSIVADARQACEGSAVHDVIAAAEGMTLTF